MLKEEILTVERDGHAVERYPGDDSL